jgi:P27 family predicted phage terminase small subunit
LKLLRGNPGRRPINKKEPKGGNPLGRAPKELSDRQQEIWNTAIERAPLGVLCEIDASIFATWVAAVDTFEKARKSVMEHGLLIRESNGEGRPPRLVPNPNLAIQTRQADLIRATVSLLGFAPVSRVSLTTELDDSENIFAQLARESWESA